MRSIRPFLAGLLLALGCAAPAAAQTSAYAAPVNVSTAPAQTSVGTSAGSVLADPTATRRRVMLVNTGTTVIKCALGRTPTATAYHVPLKAASAADAGDGGTYIDDAWSGDISCISSASGGTLAVTVLSR